MQGHVDGDAEHVEGIENASGAALTQPFGRALPETDRVLADVEALLRGNLGNRDLDGPDGTGEGAGESRAR